MGATLLSLHGMRCQKAVTEPTKAGKRMDDLYMFFRAV
ncbi:hypothetical protein T07_6368 [Trichinella nelsoni]|uniref:Uncharacterized protein n=1 Tax=Trichinella nelsoni TaxID=6336 RepID=A0A0V0RCQ2_9BILA|nr:hypothetical protein T07_6368 [Trichinella nelsoni]